MSPSPRWNLSLRVHLLPCPLNCVRADTLFVSTLKPSPLGGYRSYKRIGSCQVHPSPWHHQIGTGNSCIPPCYANAVRLGRSLSAPVPSTTPPCLVVRKQD